MRRLTAAVVALVLLCGAGEVALRLIIPSAIANAVRAQLDLPHDHPVDVSLRGSALQHALSGRVGAVRVMIPDAPIIEGLEVDAELDVESMPFDPLSGEIEGGRATLTVPQDQLGPTLAMLTDGAVDTGEVIGDELAVGRTMEILGQEVSFSARLSLEAVDAGNVLVTPRGLKAAGFDLDAEQIAQLVGPVFEPLLQPREVCVRDRIPRGIKLTGITMTKPAGVAIEVDLAPGLISDPAEQELGSCS